MKNVSSKLLFFCLLIFNFVAIAQHKSSTDVYVNGYTRSNGTYVKPHYRTAPNSTYTDNFSEYGNVNPYTGRAGTKHSTQYHNYSDSYNASSPNSSITNGNYSNSIPKTSSNSSNNKAKELFDTELESANRELNDFIERFSKTQSCRDAYNFNKKHSYKTIYSIKFLLYKLGYDEAGNENGEIDGIMDAKTILLIMTFQSDYFLVPNGKLTGETLKMISKIATNKLLK